MSYDENNNDNNDDDNKNKKDETELRGWQKIFGPGKLSTFLSWILIWAAVGAFAVGFMGYEGSENTDKQAIGAIACVAIYLVFRYVTNRNKNKK